MEIDSQPKQYSPLNTSVYEEWDMAEVWQIYQESKKKRDLLFLVTWSERSCARRVSRRGGANQCGREDLMKMLRLRVSLQLEGALCQRIVHRHLACRGEHHGGELN